MTDEQRKIRGIAAEQLLSNELFNEVLNATRQDIVDQMGMVKLSDREGHTNLIMALQAAEAVQRQIVYAVQDGLMAAEHMNAPSRID